jgi:transglutaminase-like putative cysteine protease
MRIGIVHQTLYRYQVPATGIIQVLRLTPRHHEGQYVVSWGIDVSADCRLDCREDAFGNITHCFTAEGPITELSIQVEGEVETQDTNAVVRGAIERFPPSLFLRETPLTAPDGAIRDFARTLRETAKGGALDLLHALLCRLHEAIAFDTEQTDEATSAAEAFAVRRGVCQDFAHVFIASARCLGIPARYTGGYLRRADGVVAQEAAHAWAEAFVPDLGWVGFDPANGICPTDAHVRTAIGLDRLGAAPVRGSHYAGSGEKLVVAVRVDESRQGWPQSQQ